LCWHDSQETWIICSSIRRHLYYGKFAWKLETFYTHWLDVIFIAFLLLYGLKSKLYSFICLSVLCGLEKDMEISGHNLQWYLCFLKWYNGVSGRYELRLMIFSFNIIEVKMLLIFLLFMRVLPSYLAPCFANDMCNKLWYNGVVACPPNDWIYVKIPY
jgi:hypothetical protein